MGRPSRCSRPVRPSSASSATSSSPEHARPGPDGGDHGSRTEPRRPRARSLPVSGLITLSSRALDEAAPARVDAMAADCCRQLEDGRVLCVPDAPGRWRGDDRAFLLGWTDVAGAHKNIAYDPARDRITGSRGRSARDVEQLRRALRAYSEDMTAFLTRLLARYAAGWRVDLTSFRPLEEEGRALPRRARNDLLHVDAFPSRPTNG